MALIRSALRFLSWVIGKLPWQEDYSISVKNCGGGRHREGESQMGKGSGGVFI